jgi:hypothetical protein
MEKFPGVPRIIDVRAGNHEVTISWQPRPQHEEVSAYLIRVAQAPWSTWDAAAAGAAEHRPEGCCAFTAGGLRGGIKHWLSVTTVNQGGAERESEIVWAILATVEELRLPP